MDPLLRLPTQHHLWRAARGREGTCEGAFPEIDAVLTVFHHGFHAA